MTNTYVFVSGNLSSAQGSLLFLTLHMYVGIMEEDLYCQVMTGITSSWMSTVAPPFSSVSTTCSWPSWHAYIMGVQPSWSGTTTTGAHSDEEHEITPTGSKNGGSLFHRNVHHRNKTSHTVENGHTVCGSNYQFLGWMVEQMRKDSNIREYTMNLHATFSDLHSHHS